MYSSFTLKDLKKQFHKTLFVKGLDYEKILPFISDFDKTTKRFTPKHKGSYVDPNIAWMDPNIATDYKEKINEKYKSPEAQIYSLIGMR
jgi:hypothetical protein